MYSAAAEGVSARRSAAKSLSVKSISCPTAEITGTREARTARATISVFEASAAASDDEQLQPAHGVRRLDAARDFFRGADALHLGGNDEQPPLPAAPAQNADEVADRRSRRRRDERDRPRERRNRALQALVEKPFGFELAAQFFESLLQPPEPFFLKSANDDLIVPARLVDADFPGHDELHPLAQTRLRPRERAAERDGGKLRAGVLQREIRVPARLYPQIHAPREFRHGKRRFRVGRSRGARGVLLEKIKHLPFPMELQFRRRAAA